MSARPLEVASQEPSAMDDTLSFASTSRKRMFDGSSCEVKAKGLKMFGSRR
jgi:hypothetical protein